MSKVEYRALCGREFPPDQLAEFEGQYLCTDCLEHDTVLCSRCKARVRADDNADVPGCLCANPAMIGTTSPARAVAAPFTWMMPVMAPMLRTRNIPIAGTAAPVSVMDRRSMITILNLPLSSMGRGTISSA